MCDCVCVSVSACIPCAFSLADFFSVCVLVLFLVACQFSNEREKERLWIWLDGGGV